MEKGRKSGFVEKSCERVSSYKWEFSACRGRISSGIPCTATPGSWRRTNSCVLSAGLFEANFGLRNSISFVHKFRYANAQLRASQQALLVRTENKLAAHTEGALQVDLKGANSTLRLRLKPERLLAHVDLGRFVVARPLFPAETMLQPYFRLAAGRALNHLAWSFGCFLATARDLYSHLRLGVAARGAFTEVCAQHSLVKSWPGVTFSHLLCFNVVEGETRLNNTLSVLASRDRTQLRAEVSEQREDGLGGEVKLSLGYFLAENCLVGVNHVRELDFSAPLTELALAFRPEERLQLKAKVDCHGELNAFLKYKQSENLSLTASFSGPLINGAAASPAFSLGVRLTH